MHRTAFWRVLKHIIPKPYNGRIKLLGGLGEESSSNIVIIERKLSNYS